MNSFKKIKILHIVSTLRTGGIEKLVHDLISKIDRQKFSVEVCCTRDKTGQFLKSIQADRIPVHFFGDYRNNPRLFFHRYRDFLVSREFHVVHSHLNHWSCLFLHAPFKLEVPLRIVHYHSDFSHHRHFTIEYMLRKIFGRYSEKYSNKVLGISDACLESVYGSTWRGNAKIERIYNGVDLSRFSAVNSFLQGRQALGLEEDSLVIGHVGQFRKEKNHSFIINLAEKICKQNGQVVFLLVGDGPLLQQTQREVSARGLDKKVIFAGTRTDIPELLQLMDLFVFPSLWEGFGLAVVEAQAAGLPVVVSANVPDEIPLIQPSVKLPLDNMELWIEACTDLFEYVAKDGVQDKRLPSELQEFSIDTWIKNIERVYSEYLP